MTIIITMKLAGGKIDMSLPIIMHVFVQSGNKIPVLFMKFLAMCVCVYYFAIVEHSVSYLRSEVQPVKYRWQELPQVLFLSRQTYAYLSRQNTSFVATKVCLSRQNFCRNKIRFVTAKVFCRDKRTFVATKMILVAAPANESKTG